MGFVPSVEQYQTLLVESGLLSRDELRSFLSDLPADFRPKDAQDLAKALVKAEKFTKFQAAAVYQGQIKELVLGEYEILDKLGQGGMGVVLLARHRRMERLAAVKVLPKSTMKSPTAINRFYREAKAAARLAHPNIVSAYDASEKEGTHFLVMEYVDGEDLGQISRRCGPLPIDTAVDYMIQAAQGLQYAHEQGVIHRDIKPANLLVDRNDTVKILDMGLARLHSLSETEPTERDRLTQSGQVMGTCDYMAPEQAEDTHTADHRADIYSLGCSLHRLLTGEAPYKGDTLIKILMAHRDDPIPALRGKRPEISEELEVVFEKMMAKRPEDRYQTMAEVITALEGCRLAATVGAGSFDLQPEASAEPSSDSKLTAFLKGLPEVGVAKSAPRPHGETIQGQAELETGEALPSLPRRSSQPVWLLPALIGSGVFAVVLAIGFFMSRSGHKSTDRQGDGQVAQNDSLSWSDAEAGFGTNPRESADGPTSEPSKDRAELVEQQPDRTSPPAVGQVNAPEVPPSTVPQLEPTVTSAADTEADVACQAVVGDYRAAEAEYDQAIRAVDARVTGWDFAGALQAIEAISFDASELTARQAARQEEIRLMAAFKQRIIAAINEADPRLEKADLMIRGMGGQVTSASEAGITAMLRTEETESLGWTELGDRATGKILELVVDPANGKMLFAAALLASASGDAGLAEDYLAQAKAAGADMTSCQVSRAARSFSEAIGLLDQQKYAAVVDSLERIEAEFGTTDWFVASRPSVDAIREMAKRGIYEAEAEALYAEAVELLNRKRLFDLRDTMDRLRSDYASSRTVNDRDRSPTFAEMEIPIAGLGKKIIVRLDGQGDFMGVQAAIDETPAKSLIEIQDNGPYNERLVIPSDKPGMTIRGGAQWRPLITSAGVAEPLETLVNIEAADTTLERLVLVHSNTTGEEPHCLDLWQPRFVIRSTLIATDAASQRGLRTSNQADSGTIEDCFVLAVAWLSNASVRNSLMLYPTMSFQPCRFHSCTFLRELQIQQRGNAVSDSLITSTHIFDTAIADLTMANCSIFGPSPFRGSRPPETDYILAPAQFVDPSILDCRLQPGSPCRGKASDGGDLGCRYTPEMQELARHACELRSRGLLGF